MDPQTIHFARHARMAAKALLVLTLAVAKYICVQQQRKVSGTLTLLDTKDGANPVSMNGAESVGRRFQ
mgnify:CR=1 FL=1